MRLSPFLIGPLTFKPLSGVGSAGSYVSGNPIIVDGAQWLYKKPAAPMDVVLKASRGMRPTMP